MNQSIVDLRRNSTRYFRMRCIAMSTPRRPLRDNLRYAEAYTVFLNRQLDRAAVYLPWVYGINHDQNYSTWRAVEHYAALCATRYMRLCGNKA